METTLLIMYLIMLLVCIGIQTYAFISKKDDTFILGLIFIIIFAASIGVMIPQNIMHTKKIVTPKVNITCIDNKCDTTYIYNFKNK
jgi:hypothetical protein